jgi:hypothetical protein
VDEWTFAKEDSGCPEDAFESAKKAFRSAKLDSNFINYHTSFAYNDFKSANYKTEFAYIES